MIFIHFKSHRSRERGLGIIGRREGYYSFKRSTFHGCYQVTAWELARLRQEPNIHFTALRPSHTDLLHCW